MLIYVINDEQSMLAHLHQAVAEAAPNAEIRDFSACSDATETIEGGAPKPDAVFTDIVMPPPTGMDFAAMK